MFEFLKPIIALFHPALKLEQRQAILARDLVAVEQDLQRVIDAILMEKVRFLEKLDRLDGRQQTAPQKQVAVPRPGLRVKPKAAVSTAEAVAAKAQRAKHAELETRCHSVFADLAEIANQRSREVAQLQGRLQAACGTDLVEDLGQNLEGLAQALAVQKSEISALRLKAIASATELHQACVADAKPNVALATANGRAA